MAQRKKKAAPESLLIPPDTRGLPPLSASVAPEGSVPETWLDKLVRGTRVGLGVEDQAPGDLPSLLGAVAGMANPFDDAGRAARVARNKGRFDEALDAFYKAVKPSARKKAGNKVDLTYEAINTDFPDSGVDLKLEEVPFKAKPKGRPNEEILTNADNVLFALQKMGYRLNDDDHAFVRELSRVAIPQGKNQNLTAQELAVKLKNAAWQAGKRDLSKAVNTDAFRSALKEYAPVVPKYKAANKGDQKLREHEVETPPQGTPQPKKRDLPPAPVRPKDPRASGMTPGEDPEMRDPSRVLPAYRDKAGMAVDVLDEIMSNRKHEIPFVHSMRNQNAVVNPHGQPFDKGIAVWEDPAKFVGELRSIDESVGEQGMNMAGHAFLDEMHGQTEIQRLIQDLSDYFTSPKFDPFLGGGSHPRDFNRDTDGTRRLKTKLKRGQDDK